jgi:hypothetical protein
MMETIKYFSHYLLAIGIAIIVVWLLISGFRKGLKRGGRDKGSEGTDKREQ